MPVVEQQQQGPPVIAPLLLLTIAEVFAANTAAAQLDEMRVPPAGLAGLSLRTE